MPGKEGVRLARSKYVLKCRVVVWGCKPSLHASLHSQTRQPTDVSVRCYKNVPKKPLMPSYLVYSCFRSVTTLRSSQKPNHKQQQRHAHSLSLGRLGIPVELPGLHDEPGHVELVRGPRDDALLHRAVRHQPEHADLVLLPDTVSAVLRR